MVDRSLADYVFKVLVLGDCNVGKSSLIRRFHDDEFNAQLCTTIGVDFFIHDFDLDGKKVKLQLWDTAGEEKYRALSRSFFRGADGALLVFDVSVKESFDSIRDYWLHEFHKVSGSDTITILVGNKCDKKDKKVSEEDIQNLSSCYNLSWLETSAKDNTNVNEAFEAMARKLVENLEQYLS
ncbi:predicted protein, partial [Nematostella vectensis]